MMATQNIAGVAEYIDSSYPFTGLFVINKRE
jgi:hypothetical protein